MKKIFLSCLMVLLIVLTVAVSFNLNNQPTSMYVPPLADEYTSSIDKVEAEKIARADENVASIISKNSYDCVNASFHTDGYWRVVFDARKTNPTCGGGISVVVDGDDCKVVEVIENE